MKRPFDPGRLPAVSVDRRSSRPLHRQLYETFRQAIAAGRLRPGQRLPSTRGLAAELGLSRTPAVAAFEQLLAEGFIQGRVGAGSYVSPALPAGRPPPRPPRPPSPGPRQVAFHLAGAGEPEPWARALDAFRVGLPALEHLPLETWSALLARQARRLSRRACAYGDPLGLPALREVLAGYLSASRGVRCDPGEVMIASGSQQALALCARVLVGAGAPAWVEEPGYAGARAAFELARARIVPVPVDEEGLDVEAGLARAPAARAACVTPSHQLPLGATMSAARRLRLLEWARRAGAWIVEDDYDSEYRYQSPPVAALHALDPDRRVIYVGTFSKVLFPALRIGYLVVPPDLVPAFVRAREAMDIFPAPVQQAALAEFVAEGHFARHLRRMRVLYRARRAALVEALRRELGP
ncbi:MAG TPA: PLP-dependent aminotransferase family protein, partial [Anaeromyxobacteraceae bacterium]|nr:PLP-dependent aminotransferase family protein [Anaeromyxobacteraceae bacterium]